MYEECPNCQDGRAHPPELCPLAGHPGGQSVNPPLRPRMPENSRHVRLWSPRSTAPYDVVCTESHVIGLNLHYMDRRSLLCTRATRYCYPCRVRIPLRWKGYIGAQVGLTRTPIVMELTPFAWGQCPDLERYDGKMFRRVLRTWRLTNQPQSKQLVEMRPDLFTGVIAYQVRAVEVLARVFQVPHNELCVLSVQSDDPAVDAAEGQDVH